jgi:pyruvate, water dikinase
VWLGAGEAEGLLEWVSGSGERLVSGVVTPEWEEWTPDGMTRGSGAEVLTADGGEPVGAACLAVQRALGVPADLEFAVLDTGLTWLQFRPVTAAFGRKATDVPGEGAHVRGAPASSGTATGRALLLRGTEDPRWEPGSVLLVERTDPDWVPLMAEAAALVTAEGGMLCHAAIVARELGVPCVTGVGSPALRRLAAGGSVHVDGAAGLVSVHQGAASTVNATNTTNGRQEG